MTQAQRFPPVVYVPTLRDERGEVRLDMHHLADRRTALFVYSALDRFEDLYYPGSAWVLLTVEQLQTAHEESPYDLLFLDRGITTDRRLEWTSS